MQNRRSSRPFGWLIVLAVLVVCFITTVQIWPHNVLGQMLRISGTWTVSTPQVIYASVSGHSVVGRPTLTAAFVDEVLAAAHSPAQGIGRTVYQLSLQYDIDDAYALAFFKHESQYGTTGVARYTHSWGNIKCTAGYRCIAGYRAYATYQDGVADWYQLIRKLYVNQWHLTIIERIIPVYAPASDHNDVAAYIADVNASVEQWRRGKLVI